MDDDTKQVIEALTKAIERADALLAEIEEAEKRLAELNERYSTKE